MASSITELQERMRRAAAKADRYLEQEGFEVSQQNGQRISIRQVSSKQLHQHRQTSDNYSREVFMGKIPRELFEDTLVPYMQQAGPLRRIRLMMDFSGTNRGFGFFEYENSEDADYACRYLDKAHLTPDSESPIGIKPSFDNKVLYFGGIPPKVAPSDLKRELVRVLGDTIKSVQFPEVFSKPGRHRSPGDRYAFVTFKSHSDATHARRVILPGTVKVCGSKSLTVDWAKPEAKEMKKCERRPPPSITQLTTMVNQNEQPSSSSDLSFFGNGNIHSPLGSRSSSTSGSSTLINWSNPILQQQLPLAQQQPPQQIDTTNNLMLSDPFSLSCSIADIWNTSDILGDKAKHMLEMNSFDNHLTVDNINLSVVNMKQLKRIFEFQGQLSVSNILRSGLNSIVVEYQHPSHAKFMLEAIVVIPLSFQALAQPGRILQAQLGSLIADINGNY